MRKLQDSLAEIAELAQHYTRNVPHCTACRHKSKTAPPDLCNHPLLPVDYVTGAPLVLCETARGLALGTMGGYGKCGKDAKLFSPAPPAASGGIDLSIPEHAAFAEACDKLYDSIGKGAANA